MSSSLTWLRHGDALGIAVLAHRAAAHGHEIRLTPEGYAGPDTLALAARRAGLPDAVISTTAAAATAASHSQTERPIALPRTVLYCGAAIGYPYYAYYSHCLWSLGLPYRRATAKDIANGILEGADLLILPGGFATWGLDRIEQQAGMDDAIRAFLARGGAGIGSCGGAYYFSEGRPHWLGVLDAKPRYTHEYLSTGAGLLNVRLDDAALRRDLPESMELAYYHGPVYERGHRRARACAIFESHIMSTRLFIDNPLDADRHDRVMRDRVAILSSLAADGRVVGFSPHPEMGEFLRKAMALDGYVRKYLPIRGRKTMDETLRFYASEDCLSFRLVLNAALMLGVFDPATRPRMPDARDPAVRPLVASAFDPAGGPVVSGAFDPAGRPIVASAFDPAARPVAPGALDPAGRPPMPGALDSSAGLAADTLPVAGRSLVRNLQTAGNAWHAAADALRGRLVDEEPELAELMAGMLRALDEEWQALIAAPEIQSWSDDALSAELGCVLDDAVQALRAAPRRAVEMLVLLELPVRLLAAAARIARFDLVVKESM